MSEQLARLFHETYERLAPSFGYETRKGTAVPWDQVPARNKNLMIAVADLIELEYFTAKQATGGFPDEEEIDLGNEFMSENGYGHVTRKPFVDLSYNGRKIARMRPEDATNLAHGLLACAEGALGDAFLIEFMRERIGIEMPQVSGLIQEFREWRDERDERMQNGGKP